MGIGDWGLGVWGLGVGPHPQPPTPTPQTPTPHPQTPNPQSPIPNPHSFYQFFDLKLSKILILKMSFNNFEKNDNIIYIN